MTTQVTSKFRNLGWPVAFLQGGRIRQRPGRPNGGDYSAARGIRVPRAFLRWLVVRLAAFGVVVGLWGLALTLSGTAPYLAATPDVAFRALLENGALVAEGLRVTLFEAGLGLVLSTLVALTMAAAFVAIPPIERAVMPATLVFRSVPVVAIAPLIVLMVGRGLATGVTVVAIVTFFPILVMATRGLRSLPTEMEEMFRVNGAGTVQVFRYARIPNAVPFIFTGLRVATANGVLGAMLAEWLTGSEGLGYLLVYAAGRREIGLLWATLVVATVSAIVIFEATVAAERSIQRRAGREAD